MTLEKIDYSFKHQQLSYDAKPNHQPYIRLSFYFSKLPNVSYEHFHRHWETVHADLTLAAKDFKDCHIGRYNQVSGSILSCLGKVVVLMPILSSFINLPSSRKRPKCWVCRNSSLTDAPTFMSGRGMTG